MFYFCWKFNTHWRTGLNDSFMVMLVPSPPIPPRELDRHLEFLSRKAAHTPPWSSWSIQKSPRWEQRKYPSLVIAWKLYFFDAQWNSLAFLQSTNINCQMSYHWKAHCDHMPHGGDRQPVKLPVQYLRARDNQCKGVNPPYWYSNQGKIFLDIVLSSSADITGTLSGQPKRLSRNCRRRNGGNVIVYFLSSFHSRDVLCTLSRIFVRPGFRLFCAGLAVHYLAAVLFDFREFN